MLVPSRRPDPSVSFVNAVYPRHTCISVFNLARPILLDHGFGPSVLSNINGEIELPYRWNGFDIRNAVAEFKQFTGLSASEYKTFEIRSVTLSFENDLFGCRVSVSANLFSTIAPTDGGSPARIRLPSQGYLERQVLTSIGASASQYCLESNRRSDSICQTIAAE